MKFDFYLSCENRKLTNLIFRQKLKHQANSVVNLITIKNWFIRHYLKLHEGEH